MTHRRWSEGALALGRSSLVRASVLLLACACSSESDTEAREPAPEPTEQEGAPLELTLEPGQRTFVELSTPAQLELADAAERSIAWDLAFDGLEIFTNGGVSGPGSGSAFGPLSAPTFLSDSAPHVPVKLEDRAGGAFIDWYDYDGPTHQLFSRFHVYGLRDGERYFKVQILGYYGEQAGALVSANYRLRYAEVTNGEVGETVELAELDASAGGLEESAGKSVCVNLESDETPSLTVEEESESPDWHLCLRRDSIAVNGGTSGPRGVEAVDLQAADTTAETPEEIQARTAASELELFDGVDFETLDDAKLGWRTDGVATAFAHRWLEAGSDPPVLADDVWFVVAADGASNYLLAFDSLEGDPRIERAVLKLRVKPVK